jgi:hypothetical protein
MATRLDVDTDLTLELSGRAITPEKFLRGVQSFFGILAEVTREIGGKPRAVEWMVTVKSGSNLVQVAPQPGYDPKLVSAITSAVAAGIAQIDRNDVCPENFTEKALREVRDLGEMVGGAKSDDTSVRIWGQRRPIDITHKAVANINALLASEHKDYGSIEGRLQTLSERGGLKFIVYEPLWDRRIDCSMPDELMDQAIAAFRKRVEVYGLIRYRRDGRPVRIEVDDIIPFPAGTELPSFRDVHGILRRVS